MLYCVLYQYWCTVPRYYINHSMLGCVLYQYWCTVPRYYISSCALYQYLCGMCSTGPVPVAPGSFTLSLHPAVGRSKRDGSRSAWTLTWGVKYISVFLITNIYVIVQIPFLTNPYLIYCHGRFTTSLEY